MKNRLFVLCSLFLALGSSAQAQIIIRPIRPIVPIVPVVPLFPITPVLQVNGDLLGYTVFFSECVSLAKQGGYSRATLGGYVNGFYRSTACIGSPQKGGGNGGNGSGTWYGVFLRASHLSEDQLRVETPACARRMMDAFGVTCYKVNSTYNRFACNGDAGLKAELADFDECGVEIRDVDVLGGRPSNLGRRF